MTRPLDTPQPYNAPQRPGVALVAARWVLGAAAALLAGPGLVWVTIRWGLDR